MVGVTDDTTGAQETFQRCNNLRDPYVAAVMVDQDHDPVEVAEHRFLKVALHRLHVSGVAPGQQALQAARAEVGEERRPGRFRAGRRHQEAARL